MSTRNFSETMHRGIDVADQVTPSVLALAQVAKVSPKVLANAITDEEGNSGYRALLATELQSLFVKKAIEEEKERKAKKA
mgnify:CR=1 FL=1